MKHFLLPEDWDGSREITLTGKPHHYLCRVRRYGMGDPIPCRSVLGIPMTARIVEEATDFCRLHLTDGYPDTVTSPGAAARETVSSTAITVIAAITKGRKMDLTVRQAVEAGAAEIWPVFSEHTVIRPRGEDSEGGRTDRWRRIVREAVQQSGSPRAPGVEVSRPLTEALELWGKRGPLILFHQEELGPSLPASGNLHSLLADPPPETAIMIGPEGGWSTGEVDNLRNRGASLVRLGPRILRSETAALYALAAVQTILRERNSWCPLQND